MKLHVVKFPTLDFKVTRVRGSKGRSAQWYKGTAVQWYKRTMVQTTVLPSPPTSTPTSRGHFDTYTIIKSVLETYLGNASNICCTCLKYVSNMFGPYSANVWVKCAEHGWGGHAPAMFGPCLGHVGSVRAMTGPTNVERYENP